MPQIAIPVPPRTSTQTWGMDNTNNTPANTQINANSVNFSNQTPVMSANLVNLLMQLLQQIQAAQAGNTSPVAPVPVPPGQQPQIVPQPGAPVPVPPGQQPQVVPQPGAPVPVPPGQQPQIVPQPQAPQVPQPPVLPQTVPAKQQVSVIERNNRVLLDRKSYSNDFLSQKFQEFKNSPQYQAMGPAVSADLKTTPWGYQGSSTVLQSYYNYIAQTYPKGSAGVNPAPKLPAPIVQAVPTNTNTTNTNTGTITTNLSAPVNVVEKNGSVTLNKQATYSNDVLNQKYEEFKNSGQAPMMATADLARAAWGYQGSSSTLTAFYNYMLQQYPQGVKA